MVVNTFPVDQTLENFTTSHPLMNEGIRIADGDTGKHNQQGKSHQDAWLVNASVSIKHLDSCLQKEKEKSNICQCFPRKLH